MKVYTVFKFSNGNELLIYEDEYDFCAELYYHNYVTDEDVYICDVAKEDISKVATN